MADCKAAQRCITLIAKSITTVIILALGLSFFFTPVSASPAAATPLCGDGSAPDYGFTYDLQQVHWTVNGQDYVSEQTMTDVDAILDRLNGDSIAQTMILIKPQDQVGNRVNCAVHFLRYMQLGESTGQRKDNGFVFLIVVEPTGIDVHYGVGLGLPALTASDLTTLNRSAEDAYQSTHSIDSALLTLVQGFDTVARSKYTALISLSPTPEAITLPQIPSGPLGILTIIGLACLGIIFVPIIIWVLIRLARMGIFIDPSGGMGNPFGRGRGGGGPSMRGGGGSGRSGRGN
jgi:hypothetical protein